VSADGAILLLGAGKMGAAMLRGWLASGVDPARLIVEEPHPSDELETLHREHGFLLNDDGQRRASAIVVAVKPQVMDTVLPGLAPRVGADTVVISIAAGRTLAGIERHFAPGAAIVRAMPNTPAAVGRGVTGAIANAAVTGAQTALCNELLGAVGEVVWLGDEGLMDALTAISGSGPAYVFHMTECLAAAGEALGLPQDAAAKLARATVEGAGELLHRSPDTPARLRENVTSPQGVTAAALAVLMAEPGLRDLMTRAAAAAAKRSQELAG
jgi:pyrroline-5-carboxylate reductase